MSFVGINFEQIDTAMSFSATPDLFYIVQQASFANANQTTLGTAHVLGDGILQLANANFQNSPGNVMLPGSAVGLNLTIKDSGSGGNNNVLKTSGTLVYGTGYYVITSFTSGSDQNLVVGDIIDNQYYAWSNPNNAALAADYVDSGYDTGFPAGLVSSQAYNPGLSGATPLLAGTYTVYADGTGTVEVQAFLSDDTSPTYTFNFVSGVASPNTFTLSLPVDPGKGMAFKFTASNTSAPLCNVTIAPPNWSGSNDNFASLYSSNRGISNRCYFLLHPQVTSLLSKFACIRLMDLFATNNQVAIVNWSDRVKPGWKFGADYYK